MSVQNMELNRHMVRVVNRLHYGGGKPSGVSDGRWRAMLAHLDREYYQAIQWGDIWKD